MLLEMTDSFWSCWNWLTRSKKGPTTSSVVVFLTLLLRFPAALSVLRSGEEQVPVPQNKTMGDIEELAASYERKLIEVNTCMYSLLTQR